MLTFYQQLPPFCLPHLPFPLSALPACFTSMGCPAQPHRWSLGRSWEQMSGWDPLSRQKAPPPTTTLLLSLPIASPPTIIWNFWCSLWPLKSLDLPNNFHFILITCTCMLVCMQAAVSLCVCKPVHGYMWMYLYMHVEGCGQSHIICLGVWDGVFHWPEAELVDAGWAGSPRNLPVSTPSSGMANVHIYTRTFFFNMGLKHRSPCFQGKNFGD